jgi:mannose-6-phosphate isomerase
LKAKKATGELTPKETLLLRLDEQYPKDVGILSAYFLNYVRTLLTPSDPLLNPF